MVSGAPFDINSRHSGFFYFCVNRKTLKNLKKSDFTGMRYDVVNLKVDEVTIELYPELSSYHEFVDFYVSRQLSPEKCIRYLILLYSPDSPISEQIDQPLEHRQAESWYWAGVKPDIKGRYIKEVNQIVKGKNLEFNRLVARYLRHLGNFTWTRLVSALDAYYDTAKKIHSPEEDNKAISGTQKKKHLEDMEVLGAIITKAAREVFHQDDVEPFIVEIDRIHQEEMSLISDWTIHWAKILKKREDEQV